MSHIMIKISFATIIGFPATLVWTLGFHTSPSRVFFFWIEFIIYVNVYNISPFLPVVFDMPSRRLHPIVRYVLWITTGSCLSYLMSTRSLFCNTIVIYTFQSDANYHRRLLHIVNLRLVSRLLLISWNLISEKPNLNYIFGVIQVNFRWFGMRAIALYYPYI